MIEQDAHDTDNSDDAAIRGLWSAVLYRALRDGAGPIEQSTNVAGKRLARLGARAWFHKAGTDYQFVCEAAEINPAEMQNVATRLFDGKFKLPNRGAPSAFANYQP